MTLKRLFDIVGSGLGLMVIAPIFLFIGLLIKLDSKGPVFFRQERVGRLGKTFLIHKFRTMVTNAELKGLQITVGEDSRITHVGRFLRKTKLDELPQLLDVLKGDMSLVGPRPEVPFYVAYYPENVREKVLSVKPGITDRASIEFKDENELLGRATDPQQTYITEVLPVKIKFYLDYVENQSLWEDIKIIFATFKALLK